MEQSRVFYFLILAIFPAICLVDLLIKKAFLLKYGKHCGNMPYFPLIGSVYHLLKHKNQIMPTIMTWFERIKGPFYIWFFNKPYYLTADPDELKILLTHSTTLSKGYIYTFIDVVFKNSILCIDVPRWRKHRKLLAKSFSQKQLDKFVPIFNTVVDKYLNICEKEKKVKHLVEENERLFLSNFLESICDFSLDTTTIDLNKFYQYDLYEAIKTLSAAMLIRFLNPLLYPSFIFYNTALGQKVQKLSTYLEGIIESVLDEKKYHKGTASDDPKESQLFINTLLTEYETKSDMISEIKLFGGGAAETTGTTLTAALNVLAIYPDIQEKVYQEVTEVVGLHGNVSYTHLLELKYTEMVIMETLRRFTPVPMIIRKATSDIDLGKSIIPENTEIIIPFMAMHMSSMYWDNPSEFRPERFSPKEVSKRHPYAFLPFSGGPRNCIGAKYSIMVLKTAIAKIVTKFHVRCPKKSIDEIKYESLMVLSMPGDMSCEFIPRT